MAVSVVRYLALLVFCALLQYRKYFRLHISALVVDSPPSETLDSFYRCDRYVGARNKTS